jgi:hypothetical protein
MRLLGALVLVVFVLAPASSWAKKKAECKQASDCALVSDDCCGQVCKSIPQSAKARHELTLSNCKSICAPTPPSESCQRSTACVAGKCELGPVHDRCRIDSDCITVSRDCCDDGCEAIPVSQRDAHRRKLAHCAAVDCIAPDSNAHPECQADPICRNGACVQPDLVKPATNDKAQKPAKK